MHPREHGTDAGSGRGEVRETSDVGVERAKEGEIKLGAKFRVVSSWYAMNTNQWGKEREVGQRR
jgi:hypothetical protein